MVIFRIGYSIPMFCGFVIMFVSTISKLENLFFVLYMSWSLVSVAFDSPTIHSLITYKPLENRKVCISKTSIKQF